MTEKTLQILRILETMYPEAHCELNYRTPLQLLIATCLSAQTTDRQVNIVTGKLFEDCPSLDDLLCLSVEQIEQYIHSLGFYHNKAQHMYVLLRDLKERFDGEVPQTAEELTTLAGVGKKTAAVVLAEAFHIPDLAVDTHVFRVSHRLGLSDAKTPEETQLALKKEIDSSYWIRAHHWLIFHGRRLCHAQHPECYQCPLRDFCKFYQEKE